MAKPVADTGFVVALLNERDRHHIWAREQAAKFDPPFATCEAVITEAFHLLGTVTAVRLIKVLQLGAFRIEFEFERQREHVLALMRKYSDLPMDFADACLVRMTELLSDPIVLTTDSDFRIHRRHNRQVVPCALPR